MTSNIQLLSFLVSFLFGICFYFLTIINFKLIIDLKRYLKHIITFIFVLDMIIIYSIIIYHINKGYFHIYFVLMVIFGFVIGYYFYKLLLKKLSNIKHLK